MNPNYPILTQREITRYHECRAKLAATRSAALEYGMTLMTVKEEKLYLVGYETWEQFCKDEEELSARRADQLIAGWKVAHEVNQNNCSDVITNEGQARALVPVPAAKRPAVVKAAQEAGPITAKSITEAAEKILAPVKNGAPESEKEIVRDEIGYPIPDHLVDFYKRGDEVRRLLASLSEVRGALRRLADNNDELFRIIHPSQMVPKVSEIWYDLKQAIPFAVCPYCQGQVKDHCDSCKGRGFLSEHVWKNTVPSDLKAIRLQSCVT